MMVFYTMDNYTPVLSYDISKKKKFISSEMFIHWMVVYTKVFFFLKKKTISHHLVIGIKLLRIVLRELKVCSV